MQILLIGIVSLIVSFFASSSFTSFNHISPPTKMKSSIIASQPVKNGGTVLGTNTNNGTDSVTFNIDAIFNNPTAFNGDTTFKGKSFFTGPVSMNNGLTVNGIISAQNILYGLKAGTGIGVTSEQIPTITNTGVLTVNGQSGAVTVSATAGDGINVDGLKITNNDKGSTQSIFKIISVIDAGSLSTPGATTNIAAGSNSDMLTFAAGAGVQLTTDAAGKKITIATNNPLIAAGWTKSDNSITLTSSSDNVLLSSLLTASGINNQGGGITNAGAITGATGLTSSGQITFSAFSTGIVHSNFQGVLSASPVDLASADVSGALPSSSGGTGIANYTKGDILFATDSGILKKLGIGAPGQALVVSGGLPAWSTITTGSSSSCSDCLVSDPGSNQIITPSAPATGLIVRRAAAGSADIFKVTDNGGANSYLTIDASGNIIFGSGTVSSLNTGLFTVNPANSDPISISPGAEGAGAFTGTITSQDLTQARTWTFPDQSGIVCTTSGNCTGTSSSLGGNGTNNYLSKWQSTYSLTNSLVYDNGTNVGIGTSNPLHTLEIAGTASASGAVTLGKTLGVTGATTLSDTLQVGGAANFLSTLGVSGATTLSSTVGITGNTTIGGNLNVNGSGNSYFSAGNVGIGTTNPTNKLEIFNPSGTAVLKMTGNSGVSQVNLSGRLILTGDDGSGYGEVQGYTSYGLLLNKGGGAVGIGYGSLSGTTGKLLVNGNVGIGTTNPSAKLEVSSATAGDIATFGETQYSNSLRIRSSGTEGIYLTAVGASKSMYIQTNNGVNTNLELDPYAGKVGVGGSPTNAAGRLQVFGGMSVGSYAGNAGAPTNGLIVSGNVGIGTTNPTAPLYVKIGGGGNFAFFEGQYSTINLNNDSAGGMISTNNSALRIGTNYSANLRMATDGSVGIGGINANNNPLYVASGGNVGVGTTNPGQPLEIASLNQGLRMRYGTSATYGDITYDGGGAGSFRFTPTGSGFSVFSGNVGIGTTNPGYKLDVNGDIKSNNLYIAGNGFVGVQGGYNIGLYLGNSTSLTGGSGPLSFNQDGSTRMAINDGGFAMVDVSGSLRSTGGAYFGTTSGNVGIGTTSPAALFQVAGASNQRSIFDGATGDQIRVREGNASLYGAFGYDQSGSTATVINNAFSNVNSRIALQIAGSEKLSVLGSGNVGIGTIGPTAALDIGTGRMTGGINSAGYRNYLDLSSQSGFAATDVVFPGGDSNISNSGAGKGIFRSAQVGVVGTNDIFFQAVPLTSAGYGYFETAFGAGTAIGTYGSQPILFRPNRTTLMQMGATGGLSLGGTYAGTDPGAGNMILSGNLGIGTTSPGATLDIKGILRLSGATSGYVGFATSANAGSTTYTLPTADGLFGQVLTTNGNGGLSWMTATSSGLISSGSSTGNSVTMQMPLSQDAAFASSYYVSRPPYMAFDGFTNVADSGWINNGGTTGYIGNKFTYPVIITKYTVYPYYYGPGGYSRTPKDWTFEGSNDGSNWTILDTETHQATWTLGVGVNYTFINTVPYTYYRLNFSTNNGDIYSGISELIIYSDVGGGASSSNLWSLNGSNTYYIAGKVGMGTSSPNELLTLDGSLSIKEEPNTPSVSASYGKIFNLSSSSQKLLIHMDGSNNSSEFIDSSTLPKTITSYGAAHLSDARYNFGGTSGSFSNGNSYLSIPQSPDFDLGWDNFTIDFWIYPTTFSGFNGIIGTGVIGGESWTIYYYGDGVVKLSNNGAANNLVTSGNQALVLNQWNHVALVRSGNGPTDMNFYIGGVAGNSPASGDVSLNSQNRGVVIGRYRVNENNYYFTGNLEEVRLLKGTAAWTTNFTPANSAYSTESATSGLYFADSSNNVSQLNAWSYASNNISRLTGNVGIGTANPGSALDVKGALRLSGALSGYVGFNVAANAGTTTYTLPTMDGMSGQVLTTNGLGILSWTNQSSGSGGLGGSGVSSIVPVVTSQDAAFASSYYVSRPPYMAFDGFTNQADNGSWVNNGGTSGYIGNKFNFPTAITRYAVYPYYYGPGGYSRTPKDWTFEGSNDGNSWTILDTETNQTNWVFGTGSMYSANNTQSYTYYRLNFSSNNGDVYSGISELILYSNLGGSQWASSGSNIYYNTGNVGIGTISPSYKLDVAGIARATGGLATITKAGSFNDSDFLETPTDGLFGFDTTNHRLYFRENGSWSYIAKTGGFQIPAEESNGFSNGDFLMPYVDTKMSDGAVHGLYSQFSDVKKLLFADEQNQIATLSATISQQLSVAQFHMLEADGAVTFKSTVEFQGQAAFAALAEFFDTVVFHSTVRFEKAPLMSKSTAGVAIISEMSDEVHVTFDAPYEKTPIVTFSMAPTATDSSFLAEGQKAYFSEITKEGFTLKLPVLAIRDYTYNWIAITTNGESVTKSISPIKSIIEQVAGAATESATITPTAAVTPPPASPSATISITPTP